MTVKLNRRTYDHARELVQEDKFVFDERDAWSEHRPSEAQENEFIRLHGFFEYGRWYLGIDDEVQEDRARISSPLEILKRHTVVACLPQKAGPANISTTRLKMRRLTCMV